MDKNLLTTALKLKDRGVISIVGAGGKTSLMFSLAKEMAKSGKKVVTCTTTKIFLPDSDQSPHTLIEEDPDMLIEKSKQLLRSFNHFSAGSRHLKSIDKLDGLNKSCIEKLYQANLFDWIIIEADGAKQKPLKACDIHEPVVPQQTNYMISIAGLDVLGKVLEEKNVHRSKIFSNNTGLGLGKVIDEKSIAKNLLFELTRLDTLDKNTKKILFLNKADNWNLVEKAEIIIKKISNHSIFDIALIGSLKKNVQIHKSYDLKSLI